MAAPKAGNIVRASNYPKVRYVKKAANESVVSSTTLQNDDDLMVTLDAGKTYRIELVASVSGAAAADVKLAWAVTGGVAALTARWGIGPDSATASVTSTTVRAQGGAGLAIGSAVAYGVDGTNSSAIREEFLVETTTAGTAGTLTLQWAQVVSSATATVMNVHSYMVITEIDAA